MLCAVGHYIWHDGIAEAAFILNAAVVHEILGRAFS